MKTATLPLLLSITLLFSSCFFSPGMKGSGNVISEERTVGEFHSVDYSGQGHLHIEQAAHGPLRIEGEDNILEVMETSVNNGVLKIKFTKRIGHSKGIHIYLTAPEFRNFDLSGATKLTADNKITGEELSVDMSGAGEMNCSLDYRKLSLDISGAGEANLSGSVEEHSFSISGAGELNAYDLRTKDTKIQISGAGEAYVNVESDLDASISGAGKVRYKGEPKNIDRSVSGAGSVKPAS